MNGPSSLTILSTYRCTAACRECCFESSPKIRGGIPPERILQYIDEAAETFAPTLKLIVFSGGECFLLGKNLDAAIARANSHGLAVRCVTNGFWAVTPERAEKRVLELKSAGLSELNISTGDEHQEFVPFERVVNAAIAAAANDIAALIVVEGCQEAKFTSVDAVRHERLGPFANHDPKAKNLTIFNNIWMPFHSDHAVTPVRSKQQGDGGCVNILDNAVITPHQQLASCCGLTMEHIPELKLGSLQEHSMKELYESQFNDFLKIWIALDGPHKIWQWARTKDESIEIDDHAAHLCHACVIIHQNPKVRRVLEAHYGEKIHDVMLRFQLKGRLALKSAGVIDGTSMEFAA